MLLLLVMQRRNSATFRPNLTLFFLLIISCFAPNMRTGRVCGLLFKRTRLLSPLSSSPFSLSSSLFSSSPSSSPPMVLVPVANGSEEMETVTIVDTLVRGGIHVCVATVHKESLQVICSRGIKLLADCYIEDCIGGKFDCIVCPGGLPGAENLRDSKPLTELLKEQRRIGGKYAAICAAPAVVLSTHSLLEGVTSSTCYPAEKFTSQLGASFMNEPVVVSGNVITSQGPSTAIPFSLKIIEILVGKDKAEAVAKELLVKT